MDAFEFGVLLINKGACKEGADGARGKSLKEFWETCERPDWMLWVVDQMKDTSGWPIQADINRTLDLCMEEMSRDTSISPEIYRSCRMHASYYKKDPATTYPIILNEELASSSGYFGDLKKVADVVRANLAVPF